MIVSDPIDNLIIRTDIGVFFDHLMVQKEDIVQSQYAAVW